MHVNTVDCDELKWTRAPKRELPRSIKKGLVCPDLGKCWAKALDRECSAFEEGCHYQVARRSQMPPGMKACRLVTVLSLKWTPDGKLERFKCRNCVAQTKKKEQGSVGPSHASVPSHASMRSLQSIGVQFDASAFTDDVGNAFLFSDLLPSERVAMTLPPFLARRDPDTNEELCWMTLRAFCGMIVAGRRWQRRYTKFALHESGLPLRQFSREGAVHFLDFEKMQLPEWAHIAALFPSWTRCLSPSRHAFTL